MTPTIAFFPFKCKNPARPATALSSTSRNPIDNVVIVVDAKTRWSSFFFFIYFLIPEMLKRRVCQFGYKYRMEKLVLYRFKQWERGGFTLSTRDHSFFGNWQKEKKVDRVVRFFSLLFPNLILSSCYAWSNWNSRQKGGPVSIDISRRRRRRLRLVLGSLIETSSLSVLSWRAPLLLLGEIGVRFNTSGDGRDGVDKSHSLRLRRIHS